MRLHLPGLMHETPPSGKIRWRVRPSGDKRRKISLTVAPGHPDFNRQYDTARKGQKPAMPVKHDDVPQSVAWLIAGFDEAMRAKVAAGHMHANTPASSG